MYTTTNEISKILGITPVSNHPIDRDKVIEYISIDSRNISSPSQTLFVALDGNKTSGIEYVEYLIKLGVRHFIIPLKHRQKIANVDGVFYCVNDSIEAFQQIVAYYRKNFHIPIIGITGSNGKTIVKEWLAQLLQKKHKISKSPKSYNSQIGVPLSLWNLNPLHEIGIYEAGISHMQEMEKLQKIIQPTIGVLTNIGEAHQENFQSKEEKLKEKLGLFVNSEILVTKNTLVVKYNNAFQYLINKNPSLKIITWGDTDISDIRISINDEKKNLNIKFDNQIYNVPLVEFNPTYIENYCHCIATILALDENLNDYAEDLHHLSSLEMRLELIEGIHNTTLINDTYNADMDSFMIATQFLFQQSPSNAKSIILSEITSSPIQPTNEIIGILHSKPISQLILIGKSYESNLQNFHSLNIGKLFFYDSTTDFIRYHSHNTLKDNIILIKGARRFRFEDIVQHYRKKTHSTYLKVHLNALKNNLAEFAKLIDPNTKMMIMLKASGYGLGSVELAKLLESQRADYFAVAYTDEGVELRDAGIQKPIMVMNPELSALDKLIDHHLEPEIYSITVLKKLILEIKNHPLINDSNISIHLKLETGMHRLGIIEAEVEEAIVLLKQCPHIRVKGILSHLAASDDAQHDDFTHKQCEDFLRMARRIEEKMGYKTFKHILNSEGIIRHPQYQLDMVRLGIGLFGFDSSSVLQPKLQNTFSLISKISQIKKVLKGETIGYSRNGKTMRDSIIGTINIGYADGYIRALGNGKSNVYVKNQFAPTIGNICMDMIMVDLTDCVHVEEGDEVELMGKHISVSSLAEKTHTIPYEILTSISSRVQRVYWED